MIKVIVFLAISLLCGIRTISYLQIPENSRSSGAIATGAIMTILFFALAVASFLKSKKCKDV